MSGSPRRLPEALPWALLTACVAAALYALRAAPAPYLLDSTELVATTMALAVSHPPGHPAYHLSHGWVLDVPFGTIALRLHLLSTLATALLAGLVPLAAARLGWTRTTGSRALAALVGVVLAFTNALLFQAIRGEVYAFHALIVCAAMTAVLQPIGAHGGVRNVALAAALLGVGLGNHHYLIVFAFPAFLAATLAFTPRPQRLRAIGVGCVFGAAPLLAYAYLPLRGAARPAIGWGWPTGLDEIWWTLSAKAFQKSASAAVELDVAAGSDVIGVLADQWSVALIAAAAGGVLLALRDRRVALALALLLAFNLLTQTLFAFDPLNPDVLGYFYGLELGDRVGAHLMPSQRQCRAATQIQRGAPDASGSPSRPRSSAQRRSCTPRRTAPGGWTLSPESGAPMRCAMKRGHTRDRTP